MGFENYTMTDEEKNQCKDWSRWQYSMCEKNAKEIFYAGGITEEQYESYIDGLRDWLVDNIDAIEEGRLCDISRKPFH